MIAFTAAVLSAVFVTYLMHVAVATQIHATRVDLRLFLVSPQLEEEPAFKEFISVHTKRNQVPTWANDFNLDEATAATTAASTPGKEQASKNRATKKPPSDDYLNFDSDQSEDEEQEEEEEEEQEEATPAKQGKTVCPGLG